MPTMEPRDATSSQPNRSHWCAIVGSGFLGACVTAGVALYIAGNAKPTVIPGETKTVTKTVTKFVTVDADAEPCSGSRVSNDPPYEPNNLAAQAYGPLQSDQALESELANTDDVDFYALCVGKRTRVQLVGQKVGCIEEDSCYDADLELLSESGEVVGTAEIDWSTTVGTIAATVPSGRYYVRLWDGSGVKYRLSASADGVKLRRTVPN
jgi:hypothetical protein